MSEIFTRHHLDSMDSLRFGTGSIYYAYGDIIINSSEWDTLSETPLRDSGAIP